MPEPGSRILARYLRVLLQERMNVVFLKPGGRAVPPQRSLREAGAELGIKNLSEIVSPEKGKGIGRDIERIIASRWFGGSIDRLHEAADAWAAEQASVEPVGIERVLAVAEQLDADGVPVPVSRVRAVHRQLAAASGEILDTEIARLLRGDPDKGDGDREMRTAGLAAVPKITKRKGARK